MKEQIRQSTGFEKHLKAAAEPILFSTMFWASVARETGRKMEQSGMNDVIRSHAREELTRILPNHPRFVSFLVACVFTQDPEQE